MCERIEVFYGERAGRQGRGNGGGFASYDGVCGKYRVLYKVDPRLCENEVKSCVPLPAEGK